MKIPMISELRAFDAAASQGSMSAAARALSLKQPTVSAHISSLEERFGVELFFRRGRRVQLTDFGRSLKEVTHRIFRAEEEAVALLLGARYLYEGQLKVCAVGPYNVTPMLKRFRARWPRVGLSVSLGDSREVIDSVLDYRCDVGVLVEDVVDERIHCTPFRKQQLLVFASRDHHLSTRSTLRLTDLANQDFVVREVGSTTRRVFEDYLSQRGVRISIALEMGSREAVREAVAEGLGLGVVSDAAYVADERLVRLPVELDGLYTYSHVICLRERASAPLVQQFLNIVEELKLSMRDPVRTARPGDTEAFRSA